MAPRYPEKPVAIDTSSRMAESKSSWEKAKHNGRLTNDGAKTDVILMVDYILLVHEKNIVGFVDIVSYAFKAKRK